MKFVSPRQAQWIPSRELAGPFLASDDVIESEREARKVGVGEAMVSRVASGSRSSPEISKAIYAELRAIRDYLNHATKAANGG